MERMWINQPSKFDLLHHLHGINVLAPPFFSGKTRRIFFTSGKVISMQIPCKCLSQGWKR